MKSISTVVQLSIVSTLALSTYSQAGTTTWHWDIQKTPDKTKLEVLGTNLSNNTSLNGDLRAFADTDGNVIKEGKDLHPYGNGFGLINQNEVEGDYPGHAFDNQAFGTECADGQIYHQKQCYTYNEGPTNLYSSYTYEGPADQTDYDMALVSFDTSVTLNEVGFSWVYGEKSDFTVLAFTGSGSPPTLVGSTWANIDSGWDLVGSYRAQSARFNDGYYAINGDGISAQHWLVGAFNHILDNTYLDDRDTDALKLKGFKGETSTTDVPAPAAFGLLLVGMLGVYTRRKKPNN